MDSDGSNDSGKRNPIFNICSPKNNVNIPSIIVPPFISQRNNINKKYPMETINNMELELKNFSFNIMQMMDITNRMIHIIDNSSDNIITINFGYKNYTNIFIDCKLGDKISDVINKIKIEEDGFNINDKILIFNGAQLNLNGRVKDEGLMNGSFVLIIEKEK